MTENVKSLVEACRKLKISNQTWNPLSPTFVRPWPEFYAALEAVEREGDAVEIEQRRENDKR